MKRIEVNASTFDPDLRRLPAATPRIKPNTNERDSNVPMEWFHGSAREILFSSTVGHETVDPTQARQ
jgi:hypothetical protein